MIIKGVLEILKKRMETDKANNELEIYRREYVIEILERLSKEELDTTDLSIGLVFRSIIDGIKLNSNQVLFTYNVLFDDESLPVTLKMFESLAEHGSVTYSFQLSDGRDVNLTLTDNAQETSIIYKDDKFDIEIKEIYDNIKKGVVSLTLLKVLIGYIDDGLCKPNLTKEEYNNVFQSIMSNAKISVDIEELE